MYKYTKSAVERSTSKMLYVFKVDEGKTLVFTTNYATQSVRNLQEEIHKVYKIPPIDQILLINGGLVLNSEANVGDYSAGVESNPIFLFNTIDIASDSAPVVEADIVSDTDLRAKFQENLELPDNINTMRSRVALSKLFVEIDEKIAQVCQTLIHDQRMQHQGWSAAIANLDEHLNMFVKHSEKFSKEFKDFRLERLKYMQLLDSCETDIKNLKDLLILPKLTEDISQTSLDESNASNSLASTNLYDWLISHDTSEKKDSLDNLPKICKELLHKYNDKFFEVLFDYVEDTISQGKNEEMKEIKGLSSRLQGLEQLFLEAGQYVRAQKEVVSQFTQQQNRTRDNTDCKDLCSNQVMQLKLMMGNHEKLFDIQKRCFKAKQELGYTIQRSLKWLTFVQNKMTKANREIFLCKIALNNLQGYLQRIHQIHLVPTTYLEAIYEVVRRRAFSQAFLAFTTELAGHLASIYNEEVVRRNSFLQSFDNTFLETFFPGMHDEPTPYGTENPKAFDTHLPKLTIDDVESYKKDLPELTKSLMVPDVEAIKNLFVFKNFGKKDPVTGGVEEKITQVVNEVGLSSTLDQNLLKAADSEPCLANAELPLIKEIEKGCESETDTEEFEKVSQNPMDLNIEKEASPSSKTQHVATITEENLETFLNENNRLKNIIKKLGAISRNYNKQIKTDIDLLKSWFLAEKENLEAQCNSLGNSWENLAYDLDAREKEIIDKISLDYKDEVKDLHVANECYKQKIVELENANLNLDSSLQQRIQEVCDLNQMLIGAREERERNKKEFQTIVYDLKIKNEKSLKELSDKLIAEKEIMKSRFNFITQKKISCSLSESNLEGSERLETVESTKHHSTISQIIENRDNDIKAAISVTYRRVGSLYLDSLNTIKSQYTNRASVSQKSDTSQKMTLLEEENTRLKQELLEEKVRNEIGNIMKSFEGGLDNVQSTSGTAGEKSGEVSKTLERIKLLNNLKKEFETELIRQKRENSTSSDNEMAASVSVYQDSATKTTKGTDKMVKSTLPQATPIKISVDSCHIGDTVVVLWDSKYSNYRILQEDTHMYFLHSDSLEILGLNLKLQTKKAFVLGDVIEKDYCYAKKVENRYNVPMGTKFYRIKVKPLSKDIKTKPSMSQSEIITASNSQQDDSVPRVSLPSTPSKQSEELDEKLISLDKSVR